MDGSPSEEYRAIVEHLRNLKSVLVAFSGGVDSSLLLAAARDALGERTLAVTVDSILHPVKELELAKEIARTLDARHKVIGTDELSDPEFTANSPMRCYFCKAKRFGILVDMSRAEGIDHVIEGSNKDDLGDFRPGRQASRELGILSPFVELDIGKETIRKLARERGLLCWDKPSAACLASRVPYGERITRERIERIGNAEKILAKLGFTQSRARDHGNLVRIEVEPAEMTRILDEGVRESLVAEFNRAGYVYVSLDLKGFRSGSMNEDLDPDVRNG